MYRRIAAMPAMPATLDRAASDLRAFNRFYTRRIGVLNEGLLGSALSLTETRVLYELQARGGAVAADLARELGLDPGYLSRLLAGFKRRRWIRSAPEAGDRRRRRIVL